MKNTLRHDTYIADFESALDKLEPTFNPYEFLVDKEANPRCVKRLIEFYEPLLEEYNGAIEKNDEDLVEAYSSYAYEDLLNRYDYVDTILNDCSKYLNVTRKPRKRKPRKKSVESILKHFHPLEKDDTIGVSSDNSEKILGANYVYTFNTSNNILTMFVSKEGGFTINRSSIKNYDEDKTKSKRVGRRTKEVISKLMSGTKYTRQKILDEVKTDYITTTDRISDKTLILKVDT